MANECIPLYDEGDEITATTTAAVAGKTFLGITGALVATFPGNLVKVATNAAGVKPFGVAAYDAPSGASVGVIKEGVIPVTAGGVITAGDEVESDAAGKAIKLASGKAAGRAVSTATASTDVFVDLYH